MWWWHHVLSNSDWFSSEEEDWFHFILSQLQSKNAEQSFLVHQIFNLICPHHFYPIVCEASCDFADMHLFCCPDRCSIVTSLVSCGIITWAPLRANRNIAGKGGQGIRGTKKPTSDSTFQPEVLAEFNGIVLTLFPNCLFQSWINGYCWSLMKHHAGPRYF